jgi:cytochrome c peroxidase
MGRPNKSRLQNADTLRRLAIPLALLCCSQAAFGGALSDPLLGLPPLKIPGNEAPAASLGRKLFFDARLSADGKISCSSCHPESLAFSDGRAHSVGHAGQLTTRNAPSLTNVAYLNTLFWGGRAPP